MKTEFHAIMKKITFKNGKSLWFPIYQCADLGRVCTKFAAHPEWRVKGLYCIA